MSKQKKLNKIQVWLCDGSQLYTLIYTMSDLICILLAYDPVPTRDCCIELLKPEQQYKIKKENTIIPIYLFAQISDLSLLLPNINNVGGTSGGI